MEDGERKCVWYDAEVYNFDDANRAEVIRKLWDGQRQTVDVDLLGRRLTRMSYLETETLL